MKTRYIDIETNYWKSTRPEQYIYKTTTEIGIENAPNLNYWIPRDLRVYGGDARANDKMRKELKTKMDHYEIHGSVFCKYSLNLPFFSSRYSSTGLLISEITAAQWRSSHIRVNPKVRTERSTLLDLYKIRPPIMWPISYHILYLLVIDSNEPAPPFFAGIGHSAWRIWLKKFKSDRDRYKTWLPRPLSTSDLACQDKITALTTYLCKEDEKQDHSFLSLSALVL